MFRVLGLLVFWGLQATKAINNQVPKSGFSCQGRSTGYYADVQSGCQVYHMCDGLGRQFSYTCPNATLFQQRMLICDHWYMVNCSKSVSDYGANLRIGRKMPFVDDSESNPYHRTPRPDLLSHPSQSEYDIIYRTGKAQSRTNLNLVGAESDKNKTSTTDEPTYSLPSHWSTQYAQQTTTKPNKINNFNKKILDGSNVKGKPVIPLNSVTEVPVNFKSGFKATTPVFPRTVEFSTIAPDNLELAPPLPYQLNSAANPKPETNTIRVNFKSDFKATTPVYPKTVEFSTTVPDNLELAPPFTSKLNTAANLKPDTDTIQVNYQSNFKATTPVYPKTVDVTSEEPADVGVLPPNPTNLENSQVPTLSLDFLPPEVEKNFNPANRSQEVVIQEPSKFYQAPKFEPDYTKEKKGGLKTLNNEEWENLRRKFLIPDYEFPLETVSRPSYDSVLSSFQVSDVPSEKS